MQILIWVIFWISHPFRVSFVLYLIRILLGGFSGYDMSTHVRRYAKYISEKIYTYRLCAFDFCKVKRGREDGLLRTMHAEKVRFGQMSAAAFVTD